MKSLSEDLNASLANKKKTKTQQFLIVATLSDQNTLTVPFDMLHTLGLWAVECKISLWQMLVLFFLFSFFSLEDFRTTISPIMYKFTFKIFIQYIE